MREIRNTKVCVVGGAGFLGSHLVNYLIDDRECDVLVLDNLCVGRREFVHPCATFHHCDITKSEAHLRNVFQEHEIQFVFNYAAWPYIPDSFQRPLHVFEVNATGAMNVINAAQEAGCEGVLQVSSAEIYGGETIHQDAIGFYDENMRRLAAPPSHRLDENSPVRPHSTYGVAKTAVDYFCQTAWRERETPVIALRQFNCVGERETHPYIVPEIISQVHAELKNGTSMWPRTVRLGNNSTRDFQYAGDAVRMAVELLEKGSFGEVYNMGSEDSIKMYDLAAKIGKLMGCEVHVNEDETRKRPWEIWFLQSDNAKLYQAIESRPKVSLDEALLLTIEDFHKHDNKWSWQ